ncbi:NAD-dependent protein deacetylase sirtuin-7 [Pelomyxa schiedti]|nr:NAD-dependent protein deacetylase sirtuin-7 [Pelomyxa schiedti]
MFSKRKAVSGKSTTSASTTTASSSSSASASTVDPEHAPIASAPFFSSGGWQSAHGLMGKASWALPTMTFRCDTPARTDRAKYTVNNAHEFLDDPAVLDAKIAIVAELVKTSKSCIAYCGAGLSKSSGIRDYATKSGHANEIDPIKAPPTFAHHVIAAMEKKGYVKFLIQQNHDGLPQKAGFPQEKINEIHGAWFDPSNPVVKFGGRLREDLLEWMLHIDDKSDLCLCLGTSLAGMNADLVAETPTEKYAYNRSSLGTVIINLQQTRLDAQSSVRIWAKLDDVFHKLAPLIGIDRADFPEFVLPLFNSAVTVPDVFEVGYGPTGERNDQVRMTLNMQEGSQLKIVPPASPSLGHIFQVVSKTVDGSYIVANISTMSRTVLGWWWIDAALRGAIPQLPVVNVDPQVHSITPAVKPTASPSESSTAKATGGS